VLFFIVDNDVTQCSWTSSSPDGKREKIQTANPTAMTARAASSMDPVIERFDAVGVRDNLLRLIEFSF
jgi:hypothetical protein